MNYVGDVAVNTVLNFKYTTHDGNGAPSTLSSATVKVYKNDSTSTETTTGVTNSIDFDGVTGLNNVKIDTSSDGTFYAAGNEFMVILTAGTVDSTSVIKVLGAFSIENRSTVAAFTTVNTKLDAIDDYVDAEVAAIKAKTDNLPSDPADASDIAAAFATVNSKLDAIDDYVDAEVAAIKAKTDNLPAVPASQGDVTTVGTAVAAIPTNPLLTNDPRLDYLDASINDVGSDVTDIYNFTDSLEADIAATKTVVDNIALNLTPIQAAVDGIAIAVSTLPSAGDIADAVWDEDLSGHVTAGSAAVELTDKFDAADYVAPDNADIGTILALVAAK